MVTIDHHIGSPLWQDSQGLKIGLCQCAAVVLVGGCNVLCILHTVLCCMLLVPAVEGSRTAGRSRWKGLGAVTLTCYSA